MIFYAKPRQFKQLSRKVFSAVLRKEKKQAIFSITLCSHGHIHGVQNKVKSTVRRTTARVARKLTVLLISLHFKHREYIRESVGLSCTCLYLRKIAENIDRKYHACYAHSRRDYTLSTGNATLLRSRIINNHCYARKLTL